MKIVKAIRYDGKTFMLGANGVVYSDAVRERGFYMLAAWGWAISMVQALVKLGVIPKKEAEAHIAAAKKVDSSRELKEAASGLLQYAEELGLRFTKKQERYIQTIRKG